MQQPDAHIALLVDFANLRMGMASAASSLEAASGRDEQSGSDPAGSDPAGSDPAGSDSAGSRIASSGAVSSNGHSAPERDGHSAPERNGHSAPERNGHSAQGRKGHAGAEPGTRELATALMAYANSLGRVGVARAYADWSRVPKLARLLNATRLSPVLVPATDEGEDRSHIRLTVDAIEALFNGDEPDAFVLVSGDPTLVPLVQAIRADGSEVHVVAAASVLSDELRVEADCFVDIQDVLEGVRGEAVTPRSWRTDREAAARSTGAKDADRGGKENGRESTYTGPLVIDEDFENYDWSAFIGLIDELEQRLPFVGVRYLVNKVLAPHNCGVADPRLKRELMNHAVDEGVIEMYSVGNVDNRTDPVTACRLDRECELVLEALDGQEAAQDAVADALEEAAAG
jgi:hypothetical protein